MVFRGTFQDGKVIFDESVDVPNGTTADVRLVPSAKSRATRSRKPAPTKKPEKPPRAKAKRKSPKTFFESIAPFIGTVKGLPSDASVNIDHYLYGAKKR